MGRRPAPDRGRTLAIRAWLSPVAADELAWILLGLPVLGCELDTDEEAVRVTVYVSSSAPGGADAVVRALVAAGAWGLERGELEDRDWLAGYRQMVRPFPVGARWYVDPHPDEPTPAPPGRIRLTVEPRMAFGSGSHESTQLVLLELEGRRLEGARVLDVGTGSAILAVAAAALGADRVVALDVDLVAVLVARQVLEQQEVDVSGVHLLAGPVTGLGATEFDIVLCNMIPEHVRPLLANLASLLAPGGELVLAGLLLEHEPSMEVGLRQWGLEVATRRELGEWTSLVVRHGATDGVGRGRS